MVRPGTGQEEEGAGAQCLDFVEQRDVDGETTGGQAVEGAGALTFGDVSRQPGPAERPWSRGGRRPPAVQSGERGGGSDRGPDLAAPAG
jgi:hypothetical protein